MATRVAAQRQATYSPVTTEIGTSNRRLCLSACLLVCLSASGQTLESFGECKALLQVVALHFRQQTPPDFTFQATIGQGLS